MNQWHRITDVRKVVDQYDEIDQFEIWFDGRTREAGDYDRCCKQYLLLGLISEKGFSEHKLKCGLTAFDVVWPKGSDRPTDVRAVRFDLLRSHERLPTP